MAKRFNTLDGFSLDDLMQKDGIILEVGDEYPEHSDDELPFSSDVQSNSNEALTLLNLNDFDKDEQEEEEVDPKINNDDTNAMLCAMSFEKLKTKMTDLTGDGRVMKLVKEKGVGEIVPGDSRVTVRYVAYFEYSDEPFDSTFIRGGSESFRLGQGALIPGLELGITTMQKHEIAIFIIHPDLAFGEYGCPPRIPPNEAILFSVQLLDYLDNGSADTFENLSIEEKKLFKNVVKRVHATLLTAKDFFNKKKIRQAMREYQKAVEWLEKAELQNAQEEEEMNRLLSKAYSNLAVCYNKENMPRRACIACNSIPIRTAKSHFNHGRALLKMGEYDRAMRELQISLRMEPNNSDTVNEIRLVNDKQRAYLETEKRLWGNCLKTKTAEKDPTAFQAAAREMCKVFTEDSDLLRQPLPDGLTPEEEKYIREQAAALGLSVTVHRRYDREVTYLNKSNY